MRRGGEGRGAREHPNQTISTVFSLITTVFFFLFKSFFSKNIKWPYGLYLGPGLQRIGPTCIKIRSEMIPLSILLAMGIHVQFSSLSWIHSSTAFPSPVCLAELMGLKAALQTVGSHETFQMDIYPLRVPPDWLQANNWNTQEMGEGPGC